MSVPRIVSTQSVLGYLQHQTFSFQPVALNTPTGWTSSALPAGLSLNATTGLISGAVTNAGVYNLALIASNADGASPAVIFTLGIEASAYSTDGNLIDLAVELTTREVTGLFAAKRGDDLVFRVRFTKGGVPNAMELSAMKIALKEIEGESVIVESTEFHAAGAGIYLLYMAFVGDALAGALSNHENDKETAFTGLWELEWMSASDLDVGPETLRGTSKTIAADVVRDLIP